MALLLGSLLDYALRIPVASADRQNIPRFLLHNGTFAICVAGMAMSGVAYLLDLNTLGTSTLLACLWGAALFGLVLFHRQLVPRRTLALFSGVAFLIVVQSFHGMLPAWGQRFAALPTASPSIKDRLQDAAIPVACFGQDWGSVPFYLGRNDLHYYNSGTIGELGELVRRQERVFLVLDHSVKLAEIRDILPPGTRIATRSRTQKTKVLLIRSSAEVARTKQQAVRQRIARRRKNATH